MNTKVKNKHGRVGVKKPLSVQEKQKAFLDGFKRGRAEAERGFVNQVMRTKSLRDLKKELGL